MYISEYMHCPVQRIIQYPVSSPSFAGRTYGGVECGEVFAGLCEVVPRAYGVIERNSLGTKKWGNVTECTRPYARDTFLPCMFTAHLYAQHVPQ